MAFGPRPGDIEAFQALGATDEERLRLYVEQQLTPETIDDSDCEARLAAHHFAYLQESLANLIGLQGKDRRGAVIEVQLATYCRAVYSKRQLVEVLADHWHDHFNVYAAQPTVRSLFIHFDRDIIRPHLFGNFRAMLQAVAQSPAMLFYLDNQFNSGAFPNENFARELFELHTMGAEHYLGVRDPNDPELFDAQGNRVGYIDADVYGATTSFTGWRCNGKSGEFEYDDARHFPYQKMVMGKVLPAFQGFKDGADILDLLAAHPGTARHVCWRLCRRLVSDQPPARLVEEAATLFMAQQHAPDQLKQVVRAILLSPEFRTIWGEKIKRPFEFAASALRAVDADFVAENEYHTGYILLGQPLFAWRSPDGYPDQKEAWTSPTLMVRRWQLCEWILRWVYAEGHPQVGQYRARIKAQTPPELQTPTQLVDFWSQRILGYPLPTADHQTLVDFMARGQNANYALSVEQIAERLRPLVGMILMSPSFQLR
jgi:uncharacterized protein (DUF1800 family)